MKKTLLLLIIIFESCIQKKETPKKKEFNNDLIFTPKNNGFGAILKLYKKTDSLVSIDFTPLNRISRIQHNLFQRKDSSLVDNGQTFYFDDGKLTHVYTSKNNELNGRAIFYYKSGLVEQTGFYKNDTKIGIWKYFDEDGNLKKSIFFSSALSAPVAGLLTSPPKRKVLSEKTNL